MTVVDRVFGRQDTEERRRRRVPGGEHAAPGPAQTQRRLQSARIRAQGQASGSPGPRASCCR